MNKRPPSPQRAYSYIRMSTKKQLNGDSLRRQLELSRTYAEKNGLELVEEDQLQDIGISAFKGANVADGALGRFLEAVRKGKVRPGSYLLVESLDRLSRQEPLEAFSLFAEIVRAGIKIVTLNDNQEYSKDNTSNLGSLVGALCIMSRSHEESKTKDGRIKETWREKRRTAATEPMTAICPGWLVMAEDRSRYVVIKERATIVRKIFEDSANGIGGYVIAKKLNAKGTPSFRKGKRGWNHSYIAELLKNRAVLGEHQPHRYENGRYHNGKEGRRVPDGEPIKNYFPQIVDDDLFYRVQQGIAQRRIHGRGRKGSTVTNLFSGLGRCAYCDSPMHLKNKGRRGAQVYLVCSAARAGNCTITKGWAYHDFEKSFLAFVSELDLASIINADEQEQKRASLEHECEALRGKLHRIEELQERAFAMENNDPDFIGKKLKELRQQRDATNATLQKKQQELETTTANVKEFYKSKELHEIIARLQGSTSGGDEIYKLRAQVSAKLKSLISKLYVVSAGSMPLTKMARDWLAKHDPEVLEDDTVHHPLSYVARLNGNEHGRYFSVKFKDGGIRNVVPSANDPLEDVEQVWYPADGDEDEDGSTPINIEQLHELCFNKEK